MVVGDLVEYLREHIALGYDLSELKLQLVRYGHSAKNVEEALDVVRRDALSELPQPPLPGHIPSSAATWVLTPVLLLVMILAIGMIAFLLRNPAL